MENIDTLTLNEWLDRIARPSAVWAAGSVSAVTCAQAWGLIEMIAGLVRRRVDDCALNRVVDRARLARQQLLSLAQQDAGAFQQVLRDPSPQHYANATLVPLRVLVWARAGEDAARQPELVHYKPAALDLKCAQRLFEIVAVSSRALIENNLPHLAVNERRLMCQRLHYLDPQ